MELLTFASRLFAPITFDHLLATSVMLFHFIFLVSMRSWRNSPLGEAPCNTYDQWNTADIIASK